METRGRGAFLRVVTALALAGAGLVLLLAMFVRHEQHVGLGGEIVHDDFGFRVECVDSEHTLADGAVYPAGRFLVVHLAITNHAKRVPFALDTWTPVLVDGTGRVFEPHARAQAALASEVGEAAEFAGSIERGTSITKLAVYDVPKDARDLRLEIHWGGALVNLLENLIFGEKDIAVHAVAWDEAPRDPTGADRPPRD
ncbi:MAG: DUF4352 domain-containing protein [Planctomycetes bacterium]|nr:DUF4352 domain-containing protein [Planctomycetota bacterium]